MAYSPSYEVQQRMRSELAGLYVDRAINEPYLWLVAKLPMNLIREIRAGAELSLMVWFVQLDDSLVLTFGLRVYDDRAAPFTTFGSCRSDHEGRDLQTILAAAAFPLQIHNENSLPMFSAECRFDADLAVDALNVPPSGMPKGEQGLRLRERANDIAEESLAGKADPRVKAWCELPLTLETTEALKIHVLGSGDMSLDDPDEGRELERLTFQAFDWLFPLGTFHSPQVGEGKDRRELIDVLALARIREFGNEGIFVVENKAASAFPEGLKRKTWRRAKSIQKQILDGIGQLEGAIKALREGEEVYRIDGTRAEDDPPECRGKVEPLDLKERASVSGQGLVVISDMHHEVDWDAVFLELARVFLATRYYCHVLDLKELARLITHSNGLPALLEGFLLERWTRMFEIKTAFVRFHFVGGKV